MTIAALLCIVEIRENCLRKQHQIGSLYDVGFDYYYEQSGAGAEIRTSDTRKKPHKCSWVTNLLGQVLHESICVSKRQKTFTESKAKKLRHRVYSFDPSTADASCCRLYEHSS